MHTSTHVKSPVRLSFMALTIVCLPEKKLHDAVHFFSIGQIIEVMINMTLMKAKISKLHTYFRPCEYITIASSYGYAYAMASRLLATIIAALYGIKHVVYITV